MTALVKRVKKIDDYYIWDKIDIFNNTGAKMVDSYNEMML